MRHAGTTPPFSGPDGAPLPGSIAECGYLRLGGAKQWVMIRGESVQNPPLVLLHGGPGLSETFLFRHFNAALERHFTVVYWDQRGAGRSYDRTLAASSLTVEQLVRDLDELVDHVRQRIGARRVVLFGHSWGSALGTLWAARFPEKVSVYVGSGQIGDWAAAEAASYAIAIATAERAGSRRALRKLREIGPPPYSADAVWTERTTLQRLEGQFRPRKLLEMARVVGGSPESSLVAFPGIMRAMRRTLEVMWPEVSRMNLLERVPALRVPVFLFLGRHDHWVPPETSIAWLDALDAPAKQLLWFEESGHQPFADEPEKFNRAMIERVLPVALAADEGARAASPRLPASSEIHHPATSR